MSVPPAQNDLARRALVLVRSIANRVKGRLPRASLDDLIGVGNLAATEASRTFVPGGEADFTSYAFYRIRGRMIDYALGETFRLDVAIGHATAALCAHPGESSAEMEAWLANKDPASAPTDRQQRRRKAVALASFAIVLEARDAERLGNTEEAAVERHQRTERLRRVENVIADLDEGHRDVFRLLYWEGKTVDAAADELRVHERTVRRRAERIRIKLIALVRDADDE